MMRYSFFWVSIISYNWTTYGCWTIFKICISLLTLSTSATSTIFDFSKIFTATLALVRICIPILTFPKVPSPMVLPNIYYPIFLSWGLSYNSAWDIYYAITCLDCWASSQIESPTNSFSLIFPPFFSLGDEVTTGGGILSSSYWLSRTSIMFWPDITSAPSFIFYFYLFMLP